MKKTLIAALAGIVLLTGCASAEPEVPEATTAEPAAVEEVETPEPETVEEVATEGSERVEEDPQAFCDNLLGEAIGPSWLSEIPAMIDEIPATIDESLAGKYRLTNDYLALTDKIVPSEIEPAFTKIREPFIKISEYLESMGTPLSINGFPKIGKHVDAVSSYCLENGYVGAN